MRRYLFPLSFLNEPPYLLRLPSISVISGIKLANMAYNTTTDIKQMTTYIYSQQIIRFLGLVTSCRAPSCTSRHTCCECRECPLSRVWSWQTSPRDREHSVRRVRIGCVAINHRYLSSYIWLVTVAEIRQIKWLSINQSLLYFSVKQNVTEYDERCKNTNIKKTI